MYGAVDMIARERSFQGDGRTRPEAAVVWFAEVEPSLGEAGIECGNKGTGLGDLE